MRVHEKTFSTKAEADAFVEGVEFVNDSAINAREPHRLRAGVWLVEVEDKEANEGET